MKGRGFVRGGGGGRREEGSGDGVERNGVSECCASKAPYRSTAKVGFTQASETLVFCAINIMWDMLIKGQQMRYV